MTSVFAKAVADRRRSLIGWMIGISLLTLWVAAVFPIVRDADAFTRFLEDFPPQMMALLGIDPDTFLTGAGYLQSQIYSLFGPLTMIAFVVGGAAAATAGEESDGTIDMLLAAPIARRAVLLEKAGATALLSLAIGGAFTAALLVSNPLFDLRLSVQGIAAANLSLWLLGLAYGMIAFAIGAFTGRPGVTRAVTFGLAFLAWLITGFAPIFSWLDAPSAISPFTWYLAENPLLLTWNAGQLWLGLTILIFLLLAVRVFERRNLSTEQTVVPKIAARRARRPRRPNPRATWLLTRVHLKSIWDRRKSIWGWIGGFAFVLLATFAAWPSVSQDVTAFENVINALPKEVFAIFGMTNPSALTTSAGFVSSRIYQSIGPIMIIVFGVGAVSALVAKEETSGVLDMILSNPVRRRAVIVEKAMAVAALVAVIALALTVITIAADALWETGLTLPHIVAANVGLGLLGLCFAGLALALWSLQEASAPAMRTTVVIATVTYFLNGLGSLVGALEPFRALSPFYWYLGDTPPLAKGFEPAYLLLLAVALSGIWVAARQFETRDLAV